MVTGDTVIRRKLPFSCSIFTVEAFAILLAVKHVCSDRILTFGIRSIRSPAKVGIGYYKAVKLPAQ